jgi:hypothetical protein
MMGVPCQSGLGRPTAGRRAGRQGRSQHERQRARSFNAPTSRNREQRPAFFSHAQRSAAIFHSSSALHHPRRPLPMGYPRRHSPIASAPESFATRDEAKAAGVKEVDRLTGGGRPGTRKNAQRAALSHRGGHPSEHRAALAPAPRLPFSRPKRVRSYRNKSNSEKSPRARTTMVKNQVVAAVFPHPAPVFWRASPNGEDFTPAATASAAAPTSKLSALGSTSEIP